MKKKARQQQENASIGFKSCILFFIGNSCGVKTPVSRLKRAPTSGQPPPCSIVEDEEVILQIISKQKSKALLI